MKNSITIAALAAFALAAGIKAQSGVTKAPSESRASATAGANYDWPVYGGAPENNHYSPLAQIHRGNVARLKVAWNFDTEEEGGLQTSPIVVHGVLYGITPTQKIFAL
ncbi:MAG TPA: hypothetical protein VII37_06495, partial [Candidatus Acidoferrum sp.]